MTKPGLKIEPLFDTPVLVRTGPRDCLIYREPKGILAWRERTAEGWGKPELLPCRGGLYCAVAGEGLNPQLVVLEDGALHHLSLTGTDSMPQPFYSDPDKSCLHPLLVGDSRNNLHLIYFAQDRRAGRWWFLHHRFLRGRWEEPRVVDFGSGLDPFYGHASVDRRDFLHFVYLLAEGEQFQFYYRCFDPAGVWSKAVTVNAPGQVCRPVLLPGPVFNLHLLWIAGRPEGYRVFYRKWLREGWSGRWQDEATLSPPYPEPPCPYLSLDRDGPAAGWLVGETVYRCAETATGWSAATALETVSGEPLSALRLAFAGGKGNTAGWIPATGDPPYPIGSRLEPPLPGKVIAVEPAAAEIDSYFHDLDRYSRNLVARASSLSTAKSRLEHALEGKNKELLWLSRQSEEQIRTLNQSLQEKDRELKELEERFQETIRNLRSRTEQSRKARENEQRRTGEQLKKSQQEQDQLKRMLTEKEHTVNRLKTRLQEQELHLAAMQRENRALQEELAQKQPFYRKILSLFHQISQGGKIN